MKITIENGKETVINLSGQLDTLTSIDLEKEIAPILQGEVQAVGIHAQITGVHNVLDDLTKSQRDDGQVVAGQTQNGDADEHAEQTCHRAADHEGQQQCKGLRGVFGHDDIDERAGERADAHEAGVAEAQLTEDPDGQV